MALELFHAHNSTCSRKVQLCLAEKRIRDWISRPVDISKHENLTPIFRRLGANSSDSLESLHPQGIDASIARTATEQREEDANLTLN